MRGQLSNALASSIVLVCRPRAKHAGVASRRDFLAALNRELSEALRNLQKGNIANGIIQHLAALPDSEVDVTLEIQARVPTGVPDNLVRTVSENCRTLKFSSQHFEQE